MGETEVRGTADSAPSSADAAAEVKIWSLLQSVVDPELHYNIVDLGLVYGVEVKDGAARVRMTLTSAGCPYGPYLVHEVRQAVKSVERVRSVQVELVWDPPWGPARMTEDIRLDMGFDV